jgi:hypothetical protein
MYKQKKKIAINSREAKEIEGPIYTTQVKIEINNRRGGKRSQKSKRSE